MRSQPTRQSWRRQCVDGVRQEAGVADQDTTCQNGTQGCPGPDAGTSTLPCSDCFLGGAPDE